MHISRVDSKQEKSEYMKYVITGGAGHTSKPIIQSLLEAGQEVKIIGRNAEHLKDLLALGAKTAIGSVEDVGFLKKSFQGADAVYTLVPPNFAVPDWRAYIGQIGNNYAEALRDSGVRHVVNLSSVGGHLSEGAGPVSGLHQVEESLNHLTEVHILHLRPGFFYENLLASVALVKKMNILGNNYGSGVKMVLVSPRDIAAVAVEELLHLNFKGHSIRYICSDERTTQEIAHVLGKAIGKPDLTWMEFTDEQAINGLVQAGMPKPIAKDMTEMGIALRSGKMVEDYWKKHPDRLGQTKLEDFAKTFAAVYQAN
jgi:uncharacterized protein YbjT (DUF2867 family)